jgi:hypothetical protein
MYSLIGRRGEAWTKSIVALVGPNWVSSVRRMGSSPRKRHRLSLRALSGSVSITSRVQKLACSAP